MTQSNEFKLVVCPKPEIGCLIIRFNGSHSIQQSKINKITLIEKYDIASWPAIIYNLTNAELSHSIVDFKKTADSMNDYIDKPKFIAHVFSRETLAHSMLMSRLLAEHDFKTGAFSNEDDATDYIRKNLLEAD